MAPRKAPEQWQQATRDTLDKLDIRAVYAELGVDITGGEPNGSGWLECRAYGREDITPSAGINVGHNHPQRGRYKEFVGDGENYSLFEFAARVGKFPTWQDARNHYMEKAGVKVPGAKPPKSPGDSLEFRRDYIPSLVNAWLIHKPGISEAAVRLCGGRVATESGRFTVVSLPVFGPHLTNDDPVGWVSWNITGQPLEIFQGKGLPAKQVKMKTASGSKAGWMGRHALGLLDSADTIWITEGPSDMLGLVTAILAQAPDLIDSQLVTCNSAGAMERNDLESVAIFAGKRVVMVPDCDVPGQTGCRRRAEAIAEVAADVRFVRLPYEITDNHGKDLRDYFADGHTLEELGILAQAAEVIRAKTVPQSLADAPESGSGRQADTGSGNPAEKSAEHMMMADLGLDVLGELEGGKVRIFSVHHRKIDVIPDVDRLKYPRLLQIGGPMIKSKVHLSTDPVPGMYRFSEVKETIGFLAGFRRLDDSNGISGIGCWRGLDEDGQETDAIILVGAGEAAIRNGRPGLTRINRPRYGGRLIDISTSTPWYNYESLNNLVLECSPQFAADTLAELEFLFSRWRWKHQGQAPKIIAGLVLATWVQTLWAWRPQVSINGKSNSGKSTLFKTLEGLFGPLALTSSGSTAAGIRQTIKQSARIVMLDEFESGRHRTEMLEMLRSSGRGDTVIRGSVNHKGQEFTLRHIVWTAGIESGLVREADKNRFILQELVPPARGEYGKLSVLSEAELADLGQRVLAVALAYAGRAIELAKDLRVERFERINQRLVECYAVPAAFYSVVMGESAGPARDVLARMISTIEIDEDMDDEKQLLSDILETEIRLRSGAVDTVANLLRQFGYNDENDRALEAKGIGIVGHRDSDSGKVMFISHRTARRNLLKGTNWESQNLEEILTRIPGAAYAKKRLGGKQPRGIVIPDEALGALGLAFQTDQIGENGA